MVCKVFVIGMGLGNPATLTVEARDALAQSQLVVGSPRLIESLDACQARKVPLVAAADIARELHKAPPVVASVVMSGDVGLYSGATRLYELIANLDVHVIPGVSSLAYLCARLRVPWQDVHVVSAHGRTHNVAGAVQSHRRTFVLAGGQESVGELCALLAHRGLGLVRVSVGERLSYADERITCGTAAELAGAPFVPLAVMLVENERPVRPKAAAPHLADEAFLRGKVPMTKEEVRELAVCKLRVRPADVVWDVGAGTGSVSVELARAAYAGQVLAVEKSEVALGLLRRNREAFGLPHLRVVAGEAPKALDGLPAPDRVFVGGSSGRLEDILRAALAANPRVRLCVSAVTLETVQAMLGCVQDLGLQGTDIAQVGIAKSHSVGSRHLMRAHNPVYLICAEGPRE